MPRLPRGLLRGEPSLVLGEFLRLFRFFGGSLCLRGGSRGNRGSLRLFPRLTSLRLVSLEVTTAFVAEAPTPDRHLTRHDRTNLLFRPAPGDEPASCSLQVHRRSRPRKCGYEREPRTASASQRLHPDDRLACAHERGARGSAPRVLLRRQRRGEGPAAKVLHGADDAGSEKNLRRSKGVLALVHAKVREYRAALGVRGGQVLLSRRVSVSSFVPLWFWKEEAEAFGEFLAVEPSRVPRFGDSNNLQDAATPQLLQHQRFVEPAG